MSLPKGWKEGTSSYDYDKSTPDSSAPVPELDDDPGEATIWQNEITAGFFRKRVVERQIITTKKVMIIGKALSLAEVDDIIVMNRYSATEGEYDGSFSSSTSGYTYDTEFKSNASGSESGETYSERRTLGDVVFMRQGQPYIVFRQLPDPEGVARLAKAARQRLLEWLESKKKKQAAKILCPRCNTENLADANFCNGCGQTLSSNVCRECNSMNLPGSAFCSECGAPLA